MKFHFKIRQFCANNLWIAFTMEQKCRPKDWNIVFSIQHPVCMTHGVKHHPQSFTSLNACFSNNINSAWTFGFSLLSGASYFLAIVFSSWLVRLPEYTPLITGMASGSPSFTGVSWKENKQAESSAVWMRRHRVGEIGTVSESDRGGETQRTKIIMNRLRSSHLWC